MPRFVVALVCLFAAAAAEDQTSPQPREGRDSYMDAYIESHGGNSNIYAANPDRELNFPSGFGGGFSDGHFGVQHSYPEPPHHHYGPPPSPAYGPPRPVYGPLPDAGHSYGSLDYGFPFGMLGLLDKFKIKLNLITIFKIILKVILFKKLVSFIAVICLLLFIPWLKAKKAAHHHGGNSGDSSNDVENDDEDDEDDLMKRALEGRSYKGYSRLNNLTLYVLEAIENYSLQASEESAYNCNNTYCTVNRIARNITKRVTYEE